MIKVWILIGAMEIYNDGSPIVVDNLATIDDCKRVALALNSKFARAEVKCIQVWKVKP